MAIDKVGGEYIIKGNNTNPALTPSGQSWANLLTQEKYKLWQVANQEAMRQLQTEQLTAQQRQQRVDQLRQDLQRQRNATIKAIDDLKAKQLTTQGASDIATWKAQTERDKPRAIRSSSGTSTGRSRGRNQYGSLLEYTTEQTVNLQKIQEQLRKTEQNIPTDTLTSAAYQNMEFQLLSPAEREQLNQELKKQGITEEQLKAIRNQAINIQKEITKVQTTEPEDQADLLTQINNRYRSGGGSGSGSGGSVTTYTKGKPVTQAPVTDYSGQIKALEDRLKQTEAELLDLKNVDIPSGNSIERTRKVMKDQFGIGNYQEPVTELPVIPTEPVVAQPVAQPKVQPTQETTDELMSQKDAEAYLDNLFASRLDQPSTKQNFRRSRATSELPQPPAQTKETVNEILGLNNSQTSSIDTINKVKPPESSYTQTRFDEVTGEPIQYGDVTIDGVSVQQDYEDVFRLEQFTPEMAIQNLDSRMNIEINKEGATLESVADAVQITALQLLDQNSKFRLSDPEKYDKYRDAIFDYVFKLVNPEQAQSFDTAKEIIAGKNLDEMTLYQYVDGATKEDNANLLRILQTNWGALTDPQDLNDKSKEAYKAIDFAYKNGAITQKQYKTYFSLLTTWTMVGKQLMNKSLAEQEIILDKRFGG